MMDNYEKICQDNLRQLYSNLPENLDQLLPGQRQNDEFLLKAFGKSCRITPGGICLGDTAESGVPCILVSLYALHAKADFCIPTPYKAFREIPNSMPYVGAFSTHTEKVLIPYIDHIERRLDFIFDMFNGEPGNGSLSGDFSIVVRPFPKIMLHYIFYRADDEFPASATCLFSNNALSFLPIDALADTGEYTSKRIIDLLSQKNP
ncbi:MAG: DUF3786 domain-containing protein [Desulfobacterales bacterium]|jgi:hypothetical protein